MIDVAIVGGGPAGLLSAQRLAEAGLEVAVLEEHPAIGMPTHCTGIVSLETAQFTKIPGELLLNRLRRATLCGPAGATCEIKWLGQDAEEIVVMDRAVFDSSLAAYAVSAGATLRLGERVERISVADGGVALQTTHRRFVAHACVLACGVSYRLQRQLGLGIPGQVIHTAQVELDSLPADSVEMHFGRTVAPSGFAWAVPIVRDGIHRIKLGVMADGNAAACLKRFVARPGFHGRMYDTGQESVRRLLPLRPIPKTYDDRVLVVGDAGGFTKPTTGGGIFYSLLTASLAAATLIEAFGAGHFDAAFLSRYETRWQDRLGQELRIADWLRQILTKCTDAEITTFVRALASDDVQAVINETARFNWHRDVILALVRQRGIVNLLVRSLFR